MKFLGSLILNIIFTGLAVLLARRFIPGVEIANLEAAFVVAGVLAGVTRIINIILQRTTTPSTFTFGLISFIYTTLLIFIISYRYEGFSVDSILTALLLTSILTLLQIFMGVKKS